MRPGVVSGRCREDAAPLSPFRGVAAAKVQRNRWRWRRPAA